jgi:replication-associated recombination protein RarA
MIHSLKDKSQKELVEICTLQVEEYQKLTERNVVLEENIKAWLLRYDQLQARETLMEQEVEKRVAANTQQWLISSINAHQY